MAGKGVSDFTPHGLLLAEVCQAGNWGVLGGHLSLLFSPSQPPLKVLF